MIAPELLSILCCPETHQPVSPAGDELVATLNAGIQQGTVRNRVGTPVDRPIDGALVREDGAVCFLVREGIPIMLMEESVPLPI